MGIVDMFDVCLKMMLPFGGVSDARRKARCDKTESWKPQAYLSGHTMHHIIYDGLFGEVQGFCESTDKDWAGIEYSCFCVYSSSASNIELEM